jgi:hypothetical protein
MANSPRPIVTYVRRLASKAVFSDPSGREFLGDVPEGTKKKLFELEVAAIQKYGDIDLPAKTFLCTDKTSKASHLYCAGFRVKSLCVLLF